MSYNKNLSVQPPHNQVSKNSPFTRGAEFAAGRLRPNRHIQPPLSAESVLKAFNTRAFKREQPDNPALMVQIIAEAIAQNAPLSFVLYWGKGPRSDLGEPEIKCLDYLESLVGRVRNAYPLGARVTLIFTDTHAELNGHTEDSIRSYFEDLTASAGQRGFETALLSTLMQTVDVSLEQNPAQEALPDELFSKLCASAAKWFRGDGTVEQGATKYYQLNMIEKQVVEHAFSRSIFVTFNGSELRNLFPDHLPIFYMYSLRHGVCDKPWFLPADFLSRNARTNVQGLELIHGG